MSPSLLVLVGVLVAVGTYLLTERSLTRVALGVGVYSAGIYHLFTHAFFKALLFLSAGSVIHAMSEEQDIRKMGGIWKKIPVTYVLFPDEGHGFARPENNKAFNAVTEGFLAQCLGGRAQPIGNDFAGSSISVPAGADGVPGLAEALKSHTAAVKN